MIQHTFFLLVTHLNVLFKQVFKLLHKLVMHFKVYEPVTKLSLTVCYLQEVLGFSQLLGLYLYYLIDEVIASTESNLT